MTSPSQPPSNASDRPEQIGPYRILSVIGEGGMGTVYLAEQKAPVRRRVALKVIKLGMDSRAVVARFDAERQALSLMEHSSIAKVFDCGLSDRGQPYFAMEYVKGIPITDYCDQNKLSVKDRIGLFQQVCSGIQHAHLKGVMHRDLKPDNVLVTLQDGKPLAKVIDFGLAKAMDHRLVEATIFTEHGTVVGTPEYMSPEQAGLGGLDVDTRTDVYSLGVLLYELLTGDLPFSRKELHQAGYLEMQRVIKEQEPSKPSTKVTTLGDRAISQAQLRALDVRSFARTLRGDLDWITLKALEKDRTRRYDTAQELAADLGRYLNLEPVLASPPSAGYRARKFLRKHRGRVAAVAAVVLTAVAGALVAVWFLLEAQEQRKQAERQKTVAQEQRREADRQKTVAQQQREEAVRQRSEAERQTANAQANQRKFETKVTEFNQLAGVVRYDELVAGAKDLLGQAAWPAAIPGMESWVQDCDELLEMRGEIEDTIDSLRKDALPRSEGRPVWEFAPKDEAQSFLHDTLVDLLVKFDRLEASERAVIGQRLEWARQIDSLSQSHPNAAVTWAEARNAIGVSEKYAGLTIELRAEDVLGLVPLGPNPKTGYFEFYHLRSAWDGKSDPREIAIPTHGKDGSIEVMDDTGIVFVLLPGGEVTLGSQDEDEDAPYYDAQRYSDEDLHPVALSPFFLARHELTQGQWSRLWSNEEGLRQPSYYAAGDTVLGTKMTLAHPVEQVDWSMSRGLLASHGLALPTEAQWEYGCRGGTTTARITPLAELQTVANVADATAKRAVPSWQCETWTDGHVIHAPVGSFQANGFGLYHVHGNVWEWCLDAFSSYGSEPVGDGLRPGGDGSSDRVLRGGCFFGPAFLARSAYRSNDAPTVRDGDQGLRPARTSRLRD